MVQRNEAYLRSSFVPIHETAARNSLDLRIYAVNLWRLRMFNSAGPTWTGTINVVYLDIGKEIAFFGIGSKFKKFYKQDIIWLCQIILSNQQLCRFDKIIWNHKIKLSRICFLPLPVICQWTLDLRTHDLLHALGTELPFTKRDSRPVVINIRGWHRTAPWFVRCEW